MTEVMLRKVPLDWKIETIGRLFRERNEKVSDADFPPLSVTKNGIVPQLETAAKTDDGENRKLVRAGDFVINSRSDRKGSSGLSPLDGSVSLISIVLEPINIDPLFAHHLLRSEAFQEEFYRWGHGIVADLWTTRFNDMRGIRVAVPNRSQQRAIAEYLSREITKIDALVGKQEDLVQRLRERRESLFSSLMDSKYSTARLRFLANILPGFAFPSNEFQFSGEGVRLLRGINLRPGCFNWDEAVLLDRESARQYNRFALNKDDIVVGMDRPWIKAGVRVSRVLESDPPAMLVQRVARIRCGPEIHPRYVEFALRTKEFLAHFEPDMTGVSVPHISDTQIGDFRIPVPPYREQQRLIENVQVEDDEITVSLAKLDQFGDQLRERRAALITAAVTGQINVCEALIEPVIVANDNRQALRAVVGAEIVSRQGSAKNFGRVKLQKLIYLAEVHAGIHELAGTYVRQAAGPLAPDLLSETERGMEAGGFYRTVPPTNEGDGYIYSRIGKARAHGDQFAAMLGDRAATLTQLIDRFKDYDTRQVEAITTLYAVWNDALIDGETPTDDRIIRGVLEEWHPEKKDKFTATDLKTWLAWMRRNGVVPTGTGSRTQLDRLFV
jgi:restriction endonuclease S subunit